MIADFSRQPREIRIIDKRVVYVGETVEQTLQRRLSQLQGSLERKGGHPLGATLRKKNYQPKRLWLAVRSFPLGYRLDDQFAKSFRSSQIRHLERMMLYEYVHRFHHYPPGNSK